MDLFIIGLSYFTLLLGVLSWGVALFFKWRALPDFASQVYDSQHSKKMIDPAISRETFITAYMKCEAPRLETYRWGLIMGALVLLPVLIPLLSRLLDWVWYQTGLSLGPSNIIQILLDFSVILVVMLIFIAIIYLATRFYYRNHPPALRAELRRLSQDHQAEAP